MRIHATVTISSAQEDPSVKSAVVKISVDEAVSEITLNKSTFEVAKGKSETLVATVGPDSATNRAVEWKSDNPNVATVSNTGAVSGKSTGTTTITCTAKDGSGVTATATVTVVQAVAAVKFNLKEVEMMNGESASIGVDVSPKDATNKKLRWSSSNSSIAEVSDTGRVTGNKAGTCTITASATDGSGKSASITVYVEPKCPVIVESIHWQTTWGIKNGKMGVYGTNLCNHRKIKNFKCKIECTSWLGGSTTDYVTYSGSMISPGKKGRGKLSRSSVSGFSTASSIKVTVVSVTFADGTVYEIPSDEQQPTYFSM